jgi:hypothetical protein
VDDDKDDKDPGEPEHENVTKLEHRRRSFEHEDHYSKKSEEPPVGRGAGDSDRGSGCSRQHADEHRPERPILLAVDQQLGEGAALWVTPELSDPVGSLEVGERQDVEQLGGALTYARPTPQSGALSQ